MEAWSRERMQQCPSEGAKKLQGQPTTISYPKGFPNDEVLEQAVKQYHLAKHPCSKLSSHGQVLPVLMKLSTSSFVIPCWKVWNWQDDSIRTISVSYTYPCPRWIGRVVWWWDATLDIYKTKLQGCKSNYRLHRSMNRKSQQHNNSKCNLVRLCALKHGEICCWHHTKWTDIICVWVLEDKASSKKLVLQTDFTHNLQFGNRVMAGRGPYVAEELSVSGVHAITPAHTKGKKQLNCREVFTSREMSRQRVRVKQVIGLMK